MTETRRRRLIQVTAALVAAIVLGVGAVALTGEEASGVDVTETPLEVPVGEEAGDEVSLDASVFTAEGDAGADADGRRAAVLLAHGFGGSKADLAEQAREVAEEGYVVLTWTARGFGESGGLIHLNSPDYEVADASRLLDLLAERDDVRLDGEGDPVVGMAGGSYGGAISLLAAGYDDRVDAIVPAITWNDLAQSLYPQSAVEAVDGRRSPAAVDPVADPGVLKRRWASLFFAGALEGIADGPGGGSRSDAPGPAACGRFAPRICTLYAESATTGRPTAAVLALLRRSSPAPVLDRVTAPTLLVQGEQDSLFGLDQADATARALAAAGTPVGVHWIDGGHDASGDTSFAEDLTEPATAWFDHYLRGGPDPGATFEFTLPNAALEDGPVERRQADAYPTDGAGLTTEALDLAGGAQPVVSPPGGEPTALTGLPGTGPLLGAAAGLSGVGFRLAALPGASAVFESPASADGLVVVGAPRVRLSVASSTTDATLFASLWIVSADGTPVLPRQLVAPVHLAGLTPGEPREVEVALPASAYEVEEGQALRLVVSSTDAAYAVPRDGRVYQVGLAGGEGAGALRVPLVEADRAASDGQLVPLPLLVTVGLLLAAALLAGLLGARRHRPAAVVEELADVPLVVEGLVKAYRNGFRAVDGVSWRAERGQVVGLLGPNGAGKTTTMRMLVGLIRADGGRIHVLGHEVTAGAPVLGRVGALIEGPGFLPHLTGRENLHAFWAATGKPEEAAGYDEALAIADLGVALDKPVRSYSHGMQQRLGIAQAMLGLPELLLLDEPANGLDPPQIRAMRGVLARYAASGRTVVVSSHLLSEVEQTCSHVVVMHRGQVVLEGAMADLVEGSETTVVTVDGGDPAAAAAALARLDGVTDASVDDEGRVRIEGTVSRPRLVEELVAHGVPVSSVDGRRHLEEVFMSLVGDDRPAQVEATYVGSKP